jgi:hypothetical protein
MSTILTITRRFALAIVCLYAAGAHADCVDTVSLSPAERDFHVRANAALNSFLRPAPAGENIRSQDSMTDPQGIQVCKGDKKPGDFTVRVQRQYVWPDPKKHFADTAITLELVINTQSFGKSLGNYSGTYGSPNPGRSAGLQVHNVEWRVSDAGYGVQAQRDSLRASIAAALERERLQGLVGRPLPSVAESVAMAKKAPPTQLVTPPSPAPAVTTSTAGPASAAPAAPAASPPPASPSGAAPSAPAPADSVKDAADAVQKLRGLFGR